MGNEDDIRTALILARGCRVGESLQKKGEKEKRKKKVCSYKFPAFFMVDGTSKATCNESSLPLPVTRL